MLYEAVGDNNVTWNSACLKVPLVPSKYSDFVKNKEEVNPVEDDYYGNTGCWFFKWGVQI